MGRSSQTITGIELRIVVHGVGAVGGILLAALSRCGADCVGIGRGAMLDAITAGGLRLRTPELDVTEKVACVEHPSEIGFRDDDVILMTMKGQHTQAALEDLRAAGLRDQAIYCFQNGVANERAALRILPNVHGGTVMMPSNMVAPGVVASHAGPRLGMFDIGRYPGGSDETDQVLAQLLEKAGFAAFVTDDVMPSKYGKLLMNLGNIVQAALGVGVDTRDIRTCLEKEAEAVFRAAGIAWQDVSMADPRREEFMHFTPVPDVPYRGGSTTQSFARATGSAETDYLNGEVVLLGRLHDIPTPANAYFCALAARMLRDRTAPGAFERDALLADLAAISDLRL